MTLSGVASLTGGGNPRPSALWRKSADKFIENSKNLVKN